MDIIVALDCDYEKAKRIVEILSDRVRIFKIGSVLFVKNYRIIEFVISRNCSVFLDLKLFDIPNTVRNTVKNLIDMNIYSLSVHIAGGPSMLRAAKESAEDKIKIWGVSILTSIDAHEYSRIGFRYSLEHQVLHFARIAEEVGIDGVISSPRELYYLKRFIKKLKFITPSIRLEKDVFYDDQRRFMTPCEAVKAGADYIVVGRPVIDSPDPRKAIETIIEDINGCKKNT
ncbi:MAG: orotidine-5'-phosphate decarboxylase [Elusimicrobiales bacterium]